ncbi:MAG: tRNA (guanosine(46)-N7)-methyltransferase TrmB [Ruminiclostridium sp.]|nr:tRNA (guanosine(46)-N7)-methyltransferase TrmB [Ruminiclostridium sp.]MBQ8931081.1 tRNA (guanosine(46)-N7)-methyltransferase TrmB [Ruminiclostridium sp.]
MRMRRKKHLEERLDDCSSVNLGWLVDYAAEARGETQQCTLDTMKIFGNNNPVHLEVGCGKGGFVVEAAKRNPDINYIAVEMARNVIVSAMEQAREAELPNLKFLMGKAEYLEKFFPEKSVERIYLNFSCPYPKETYKKHRLTHSGFLEIYKRILIDGGEIHQKTDNMKLFEFSIESFSSCGFRLRNISLDLHNSDFEGNIVTEYEKRFSDAGFPIYRLEAINS